MCCIWRWVSLELSWITANFASASAKLGQCLFRQGTRHTPAMWAHSSTRVVVKWAAEALSPAENVSCEVARMETPETYEASNERLLRIIENEADNG